MKVTIEHKEKHSEDIFIPGNIVKSGKGVILIANKTQYSNTMFCGVVLEHEEFCVGDYSDAWSKSCFTKFVGTIMLEQE